MAIVSYSFSFILACGAKFVITGTDSGYQTRESFENFVKETLIGEIDKKVAIRDAKNPVFFFIDGHKSHNGLDFTMWCRENHIHLVTFYPNATRILQMADVGMFAPAKRAFTKEVQNWRQQNKDKLLDEVEFISILMKANQRFIKPETIKNGFRATGIHPLNVENIHFDRCFGTPKPAEVVNTPTEDSNGSN